MIRNYRVVMAAALTEAQQIAVREDLPGVKMDRRRRRLTVPGDLLQFAQTWFARQGLSPAFTLEEVPFRRNPVPKERWVVPPEEVPDLRPDWAVRMHPKQREALTFAQRTQGSLIELPTGTGKTLVAVAWFCTYLRALATPQRVLFVTPFPEQVMGSIQQFTTGQVKAVRLEGKIAFRAVRVDPRPVVRWVPTVSRQRLRAEIEALTPRQQEVALAALERGSGPVPKPLKPFIRVTSTQPDPYWRIIRKTDRALVGVVTLDEPIFLLDEEMIALRATIEKGAASQASPTDRANERRARAIMAWGQGWKAHDIAVKLTAGLPASPPGVPAPKPITEQDVREWIGEYNANMACTSRSERDLGVPADTEVIVMSWALLASRAVALKGWAQSIIFDESHYGKSRRRERKIQSQDGGKPFYVPLFNQSWAAAEVASRAPRVLLLSATPDENTIEDLWAQYDLINPEGWGYFPVCGKRYFGGTIGSHGMVYGQATNVAEFRARSAKIHFRVDKSEFKDLSPMTRQITRLGLGDLVAANATAIEWKLAARGGQSGTLELKLGILAEQMHPYLLKRVAKDIADEQRVVIATGRKEHVARIVDDLRRKHPQTPIFACDGDVPEDVRLARVQEFRKCPTAVFVGTIDSMGTGLDGLQCSHRAYVAMLPWNHGALLQLEGRFERFDEYHVSTIVEFLIAEGTVAEDILTTIIDKAQGTADLLDAPDRQTLVGELSEEVGIANMPAALETLAQKLLAAAQARAEAIAQRESTLVVERATDASEDSAGTLEADDVTLYDEQEVFIDPWREND